MQLLLGWHVGGNVAYLTWGKQTGKQEWQVNACLIPPCKTTVPNLEKKNKQAAVKYAVYDITASITQPDSEEVHMSEYF